MIWICDNCGVEWHDDNTATDSIVRRKKDCQSCTVPYEERFEQSQQNAIDTENDLRERALNYGGEGPL